MRRDDAAGFSGTRSPRTAFGRPSRAHSVTPAAALWRPSPTLQWLRAPRCGRQRSSGQSWTPGGFDSVADPSPSSASTCETGVAGANCAVVVRLEAPLIGRDGQTGLVRRGCQLGRQMLDDALAARVLVCGRALGALLLLSLLSLARDYPRAHIVPRAKPTVVCAVCRGICHSGTGRARVAGPATV